MSERLDRLQDELGHHLEQIGKHFKPEAKAKLTLVVRMPGLNGDPNETGIVISDDDLNEAIAEIQRRISGSPHGARGPCTNTCPRWFTGHWRDWHRGHGCEKDDGKPRSMGAALQIAANGGGR